ncbi:hypothetical protein RB201_30120 [Streptomyces sp. S1A(2023)]
MRPTLAAQALRDTTVEYLTTTFALAEPATQAALTDFLTDPADGLFRGPYHRIRRPFRGAEDGWQRHLDWYKGDFRPYAHQAEAFARLTTKRTGTSRSPRSSPPVRAPARRNRSSSRSSTTAAAPSLPVSTGSRPCCSTR